MMKFDLRSQMQMSSFNDLFTAGASEKEIINVPIEELHDNRFHTFKPMPPDRFASLKKSVSEIGVVNPLLCRPLPENASEYEIIAGHTRKRVAQELHISELPVIVRNYTDDEARIIMFDTNIQRGDMLPSELAYGLKCKYEAMKHQGKTTVLDDLKQDKLKQNPSEQEENIKDVSAPDAAKTSDNRSRDDLANSVGMSGRQIARYIQLCNLIQPFMEMLDQNKLTMNAAYELSFLAQLWQRVLLEAIELSDMIPSQAQAKELKEAFQTNAASGEDADYEKVTGIVYSFFKEPEKKRKFAMNDKQLAKYFPPEYTQEEITAAVFRALDRMKEMDELLQK